MKGISVGAAPSVLVNNSRVSGAKKTLMAMGSAIPVALLGTMTFAFANSSVDAGMNVIFSAIADITSSAQSGLISVVAPIAIVVCIYFAVRMMLASEPRDVATYRKRIISTVIIAGLVIAVPGLIRVAQSIGDAVNAQLT